MVAGLLLNLPICALQKAETWRGSPPSSSPLCSHTRYWLQIHLHQGGHICAPSHISSSNTLQRQQIHKLKALGHPGRITAAATLAFPGCLCWVRLFEQKTPFATEKPLVCAAGGEPSLQGSLSRVFILSHHKLANSSAQRISLSSTF